MAATAKYYSFFDFNLDQLSRVCYCAMIILLTLFLWVALTPRFPCFQVTSVNVTSLATNTAAELTATFHVDGVLGNPNVALSIWYESLYIALSFHDDSAIISLAPVEPLPFLTEAETDTPVWARFAVTRGAFPKGVVKGIAEQRLRGSVRFGVALLARVSLTRGAFRTRVYSLRLECSPLKVVFSHPSNNGSGRLLAPSDCYVV